jgi:hypothetical protein
MPEYDHKTLHWFRLCNSAEKEWVYKRAFYAFKTRFLHRYGVPSGFDRQIIDQECWACAGTGLFAAQTTCNRCGGDGVHSTAQVWLARYDLAGQIYHIPHENPEGFVEPVREIEGLIQHRPLCTPRTATRCYLRLLLRHEPARYWDHWVSLFKRRIGCQYSRFVFRLANLRNRLDLPGLKPIPDDDIPF